MTDTHSRNFRREEPGIRDRMQTIAAQADVERSLLDQAFSRAAGAQRIAGNRVRLLRDAAENYPPWLEAIAAAERYVHFESYIIRDDRAGHEFADALMAKAHEGVPVRLLYDWMGAVGRTSSRFWTNLRLAGVDVRCFNPLRLSSPFGWVHRDHRKSLVVDGRVGFITGLCVGDAWVGDPVKGIPPWRDTGVEIRGPAVAEIAKAFARVWAVAGAPLPTEEAQPPGSPLDVGGCAVRIVASEPASTGLLRVDEFVAAATRETLWLTDAYFAGIPSYMQALRSAALDGVDVRLLVPGGTDIPILRPLSRAGYRPLLEAGVRVFEWKGPMLHAKTAVADGRWARVGSSNLNVASWLGNYELDAIVEDDGFAHAMVQQYIEDLTNATEVVLNTESLRRRVEARRHAGGTGSAGRAVAGAIRLGNTVAAAMSARRVLQPADTRVVAVAGSVLIAVAVAAMYWPRLVAIPVTVLSGWIGGALLVQAYRLHRRRLESSTPEAPKEPPG